MRVLMVYRTENDLTGREVKKIKVLLEAQGHKVDLVSRNENLHLQNLSSSMDALKDFVVEMDKKDNYDRIYTHDWSIAFPLLFPTKILFEKHYCLFHGIEEVGGAQSKVMQKIAGNLLGDHLFVKTEDLKRKFPRANMAKDGTEIASS